MWRIKKRKKSSRANRREAATFKALGTGFEVFDVDELTTPLILASPHSGRQYPESLLDMVKLPLPSLRLGEDAYIDRLILPLAMHRIPMIHAQFPRCFVDVNRGPYEIPPEFLSAGDQRAQHASPRAKSGLGVIPRRIAQHLNIYEHELTPEQVHKRLEAYYHPYHDHLRGLIHRAREQFGSALVIDCHSMPGHGPSGDARPDIILGDRFGKSCAPETTRTLEDAFGSLGYSVSRNNPYAGGYVTRHYGQPQGGVEVIQIEINKSLYLNTATFEPHAGMDKLITDFEMVILRLIGSRMTMQGLAAQ